MSLTCIKQSKLMDQWGDSLGCAFYDGNIHVVGQAVSAIHSSSLHYIFDVAGNRIAKFEAPYGTRAEACISTINGLLTAIGGTTQTDIWQFNPAIAGNTAGSWYLINPNFAPAIGSRIMACSADVDGWCYIIGGWDRNTVYKTQDFLNWTLVCTLPAALHRVSAFGCCVFNGLIWIIGGGTNMPDGGTGVQFYQSDVNGGVYALDPADGSVTEMLIDQERFGNVWLDVTATDDFIYVNKGYIDSQQLDQYPPDSQARAGNNRGLMRSPNGIDWEDMGTTDGLAFLFERHRAGAVSHDNIAYYLAGFNANDMWKITS